MYSVEFEVMGNFKEGNIMNKWQKPELEELNIRQTAQGKNLSSHFDEIRVDQNGKYWASFVSGFDSKPDTDGTVKVK